MSLNPNLILTGITQRLPGGSVDASGEFFAHEGEMYVRTKGVTYSFNEFPQYIKDMVSADMDKNPVKIGALVKWGLLDLDSQMRQYLYCLYGGHDDNPDFDEHGVLLQTEYVDCGRRCGANKCEFEGELCNSLTVKNGVLNSKEITVLKMIAEGYLDKEIASALFISDQTVRYYKDSLCKKSGLERKPALSGLAYMLGLIKL